MLMMFYNITWLKELGFDGSPPETPDEMREMACAAAEANGDGTGGLIIDTGASAFAGWAFAFGGDILNEDGDGYTYNTPEVVNAMTFLKGMYDDGCAFIFEGYPNPAFAARQAIFTTGSSSGMPYYAGDVAQWLKKMALSRMSGMWQLYRTPPPIPYRISTVAMS